MRVVIDGVEYVPKQDVPAGSLAEVFVELRLEMGVTLERVASEVGMSKTYLWQLESGKSIDPSFRIVARLARYYGVDLDSLPS